MGVIFGRSKSAMEERIHRRLLALSSEMRGVIPQMWDQRHTVDSPCERYFEGNVIGSVDTFPIRVYRPKNREFDRATHQPKYKAPVIKIQVVVGHTGLPIFISGPHLGVRGDIAIWRQYGPKPQDPRKPADPSALGPDERILGDKAYVDRRQHHLIAPFKAYRNHPLRESQEDFNTIHRSAVSCQLSADNCLWTIVGFVLVSNIFSAT